MVPPTTTSDEHATQRLLDAAEKLFAEKGFGTTSVREITTAAKCNVAAVNYHFGNKQNLYVQVFQRRLNELREQRLAAIGQVAGSLAETHDVEMLLRAFAQAFLRPLVDPQQGPMMLQLMMREMINPHLPPGMFVEEMARPIQTAMVNALTSACPGLQPKDALLCLHSLIAQLIHLIQARKILADDHPILDTEGALEHVLKFSAAGIKATAGGKQ